MQTDMDQMEGVDPADAGQPAGTRLQSAGRRAGKAYSADQPNERATAGSAIAALAPFVRQRTVLLTTFRRNGMPVGTPVNIAVVGERAYVRTWDATGKFKRIRGNPEVVVAPSTVRGRPTGPAIRARALILEGPKSAAAGRALAGKHPFLHGVLVPLVHCLRGNVTVHVELRPVSWSESLPTSTGDVGEHFDGR